MQSNDSKILNRIRRSGKGAVFTPNSFLDLGSRTSVDVALHRLVKKGSIRRLARGLYDYPSFDPDIGTLAPKTDSIIRALRGRDNITIEPSGGYAANLLGLSDQVPTKVVFLTNGPTRTIKLDKQTITLKHTTPRSMATAGRTSGMVIRALRHIGRKHVSDSTVKSLQKSLSRKDKKQLLQDIRYAPAWISSILRRIADEKDENL